MTRTLFTAIGILFLSVLLMQNSEAAPSTGTIQVAFILSEFENQAYQDDHDQAYFDDLAFGETDSMWDYFDEVSRSQLNVQGTVYGPYELDGDAADYGTENSDFVRDSVAIADDDIDFRDYDAVVVVHSGPGEESSGNSDDIWSVHWPSISISTNDDDFVITKISQVPEYETISGQNNPLGVWCHEFGHEIGLPDLYDTDGSSAGIGDWGVMASGSWGNNGETPTYMSAWSRYWLGWVEPIVITDDINNLELKPIETDGDVYLLPIPGNWSNSKQYYLLENRQKMKYDEYLPGEGLLIWHIDEEVINSNWNSNTVNDDEEHKGVDLEEADGDDDLDSKTNYGDEGDPYNSGNFNKDTYPNSLAYNGTESGWKIENIETDGDNIIVDISFLSKPRAVADADYGVIAEGFELQFYGNESSDEDGNIVSYTWDFGDGEFAYIDNPIHVFNQNGIYEVKLTVCDNNDLCDSMILSIFVNKPPIAVVEISEMIIHLGDIITFDASESYDIDGEVEFFLWNFDDGFDNNQATIEYEFRNSGFYNVSLKITDDRSDITSVYYMIEVINKLPIVDFTFDPGEGDTKTIFSFSDLSYDNDGSVEEWRWDFGDSETSEEQNPEHRFALPGTYTITLTVYDDQDCPKCIRGENSTSKTIIVANSPPEPDIQIPDGINLGERNWKVPLDRLITIDGAKTLDNENDELQFFWSVNGEDLVGKTIEVIFTEETIMELRVLDSRGGENTEIFTIKPEFVPSLSIENWNEYPIEMAIDDEIIFETKIEGGEVDLYRWNITQWLLSDESRFVWMDEMTTNNSLSFPIALEGEYLVKISGRHIETNLWTENYTFTVFVHNNPHAYFTFNETINEGTWITFDATSSSGFWNSSESRPSKELELNYEWYLDGEILSGTDEIINILIESGGIHTIGLTVLQEPAGKTYYESEFYTDYKPWGIMTTFPQNPRYGEDFELYLNAYDEESEAVIDSLKITVYDYEGTERAVLLYEDQGANFNVIFEVEYTGNMILEYQLTDEMGNFRTNFSTVEVLGWVDIYVESIDIKGKKETGETQTIEFILANYNETYQTSIYNGQKAVGTVDLLIENKVVSTWSYEIEPNESEVFIYEWKSIAGLRQFEVIAYVTEGEIITNNNNLSTYATFKSDRKSGFVPSINVPLVILATIAVANFMRRKPN